MWVGHLLTQVLWRLDFVATETEGAHTDAVVGPDLREVALKRDGRERERELTQQSKVV